MTGLARTWRLLALAAFLLTPACGAADPGSPPPPPDSPDAGPVANECEGNACGVPGTDPCCTGTTCINFSDVGDVSCALITSNASQCASGCLAQTQDGTSICAPEEYCGVAGIDPERLCDRADTCDWGGWTNQNSCTSWYEGCLGPHSASDQLAWMNQVETCMSYSSCADFSSCMYNHVDVCW